jgi:fatty acid desaturase
MSRLRDYMSNLVPVPIAAPETPALRRARFSLIVGLVALAAIVGFWPPLHHTFGILAVAVFAGLAVMIVVQGAFYVTIKRRADDEWLFAQIAARRELEAVAEEVDR